MKNILYLTFVLLAFFGCQSSNNQNDFVNGSDANEPVTKLVKFLDRNGDVGYKKILANLAPCVIPTTREQLDNIKVVTKTYTGKESAGISIPGFAGLTLGRDEISYSVYYIEPKVVTCDTSKKVYGIGYSMHLRIKKLKKGLSLDKLPYIAASVQLESGKTEVYYSMQSYGLSGIPIVKFFKPVVNKPFDVEGFNIMQSSIDGIHGFLADSVLSSHLKFRPQELSFIKASEVQ